MKQRKVRRANVKRRKGEGLWWGMVLIFIVNKS